MDYVLTILFSVEMGVKIVTTGLVLQRGSYLRDPWNVLDGCVVLVSYVSYVTPKSGGESSPTHTHTPPIDRSTVEQHPSVCSTQQPHQPSAFLHDPPLSSPLAASAPGFRSLNALRALRSLRALRPLRVIQVGAGKTNDSPMPDS